MDQTELPYQVKIENFEGPLDLLLHLIKKNEINIYDIPVALIAQQYLDYLSVMKELNLAVAGEFLVMAATLLHIKSRMLLPAEETEGEEEEGPDPREELVRRLLEYKQFKEAASQLDYKERLWRDVFTREGGPPPDVLPDESLLDEVSLFDLVDALQGVLARHPGKKLVEIIPDNLTVRDRMNAIIDALESQDAVAFTTLFDGTCHRIVVIVTFLALLELIRIRVVRVYQGETFGAILVSRAFSAVTEADPAEDSEWRNL
ncbi:MAG TPA: segregation/condensation protein A [Nitrospiraceae bacterium]|nr:segregation/condensation protein A [Nitrospiraceae bacterium]